MTVCSLTKNSDDFNIILNELNISFEILAITESGIKKDLSTTVFKATTTYFVNEHLNI